MGQEQWTVMKVLNWSCDDLKKKGVEKPRLDAEILLSHTLGLSRLELYTNFDKPMSPQERESFKNMLKRRREREPIAYILGHKEFYSMDFNVSASVLVPRPETELLVDRVLKETGKEAQATIADVGTGSGCIAVAIAKNSKNKVYASDISQEALTVAQKNAAQNEATVTFAQGSLLAPFEPGLLFDGIVSNPPYIETETLKGLSPELAFEPKGALDGGADGLDVIRPLVDEAKDRLVDGGFLLFEIGFNQGEASKGLLADEGYTEIELIKDLAGHDRALFARRRAK